MRAASEFSNLLETAEYSHWANDTKNHPEATLGFDYYKVKFIVGGHVFEGLVNIANSENGRIFYDITKIKEIPDTSGKYATVVAQSTSAFGDLTNDSIPAKTPNVNSKFSVSEHPRPLPVILPGGEEPVTLPTYAETARRSREADGGGQQKTASVEAGNVDAGDIPLVERVRDAIPQLSETESVAAVTGTEIPQDGRIVDRLVSFVNAIGNKVNRPGFGDVLFSRGKIKSSMVGHGVGAAKLETFAAVPAVIRSGQQIDYQQNWKGRAYDTYTFAAPIDYKGQKTYLGVIVQKDSVSNRYYLHEVVDEHGNIIFKNGDTPADASDGTSALTGDLDTVASAGDINMIPQAGGNVKAEMYARRLERAGESVETAARLGGLIARAERGQLLTAGEDMAIRENKNAAQLLAAVRARAESAVSREGQAVTGAQGIMLPTYAETERRNRAARASTELERSGILAGVPDEDVALAKRLSGAIGRDIVFYREGATEQGIRNGFFSSVDGKIHVNAESRNPLAQIVSHELTHSVELADAYGRLQGIVLRRIQETGGDLAALRQEKRDLYARNGVALGSEGEIDQEIVAEYVEQYLLTDEESILELTRQDRGLARRILDWLDSILARLGSRAAKERVFLTEARAAYAKALEETTEAAMRAETAMALESLREDLASGRITEAEFDEAMEAIRQEEDLAGVSQVERNSISETESGEPFVEVEEDILDGVPEADWVSTVKENLKQKFPNGVTVGNSEIHIDEQSRKELTYSRYMQWLYNNDKQMQADKLRATNNADEILQATTDWVNEGLNHPRKDSIADFARGNVLLRVGGADYTADVVVGTKKNGSMLLYDILNLQPTSFTKKETTAAISANPSPGAASSTATVSSNSIFAKTPNVNSKFSVSKDPGPLPVILPGGETVSARDSLPAKARSYLERVERAMLNRAGEALGVSQFANRESLANMVRELSTEYLERGKVSQETTDRLFDQAYEAGIVADTAFYDEYRELKNHLRGQAVTIADQDKADIADFNSFRKSAFGTLNIVNEGGMPVDEAYQELRSMAPELFPELTRPGDQLKRMFEVGRSIRKAEHTLEQYHNCHSRNFNPCSPWRERGGLQHRHPWGLQEPGRAGCADNRLPERSPHLPGGGSPAEHHGRPGPDAGADHPAEP